MAPDSTTTYIERVYRLVGVDIKEAVVRPIHQRRTTIAVVTDILRVVSSTPVDIMRLGTTESYRPMFGFTDMAMAA